MKLFKAVLKSLQESGEHTFGGSVFTGFGEQDPRSALSDRGVHYAYKEPAQLQRLNAFVNSFLQGSYMDPKEPLKELVGRLSHIGLRLKLNNDVTLTAGPNSIPIKVFGEIFGTTLKTDLLKEPFDTGEDYPDMGLSFTLLQTANGFVFTDVRVLSELCTDCPKEVGTEIDNTKQAQKNSITSALITSPQTQTESVESTFELIEEKENLKDPVRVVEMFLSKDSDASKRILQPIYTSLKSMKKKGKYTAESAMKRFHYAVGAALRTLANDGRTITLSDDEKNRAAKRLLFNFEKMIKSIQD